MIVAHNMEVDHVQILTEYDQEAPQSHTADQPMAPWGRDITLTVRQSIPTSSLFLREMIAKLGRTLTTAHQIKDQSQNTHKVWEQQ